MRPVTATYRLQFGGDVTFARAGDLAPYLARLGVSHLYASPVFDAAPGSTHGYDVTDYNTLRPELGGREGFDVMVRALHAEGLGLILDIVPNHMAASPHNPWLADVMAKGRASEHADTFDIDWDKGGKLVLPVLGQPLEKAVAAGELSVVDDDRFGRALAYFDKRYPLADGSEAAAIADTVAGQHYELSYWRDLDRLNYRRFFDITDLIGVRMENEAVFERSHRLIRELIEASAVDGLRVDHVDGMRDPKGYLDRLAALFSSEGASTDHRSAPPRSSSSAVSAAVVPPIWVEKIVEGDERLPAAWPVRGETGYAVMPWLDGVFVNRAAEGPLTDLFRELTGDGRAFAEVEHEAKREVVDGPFAHEFGMLARRVAERLGAEADAVRAVIEDVAIGFPVYRTYLPAEGEADRLRGIAEGVRQGHDSALFDRVLGVLADGTDPLALTFQQMTGPVTAKAVEDTSFYRWHRWSALNEVGGDPSVFGRSIEDFHDRMTERAAREPGALSATATHDTKRGEDVRARLIAATYEPDAWADAARAWWAESEAMREGVAPVTAYLIFQTVIGFWPTGCEDEGAGLPDRLVQYALKAARERKRDTSWTDGDADYEARLEALARAAREGRLAEIARTLAERLAPGAEDVSVARAVLKAAIPGVPDTYQGTEVTDLSLVDPDNRRAVDFGALARRLDSDAPRKLAATAAMLRLRRERPSDFAGGYERLDVPDGTLAFSRGGVRVAVVVVPGAALPEREGDVVLNDPAARVWIPS